MPAKGNKKGTVSKCQQCGTEIYSYPGRPRLYCSRSCAVTARNRTAQNPSYKRDISGEKNPMYGKRRTGEKNPMYGKRKHLAPRWTGGRKHRKDGYIFVVAPEDHPYPSYTKKSGLKYILEHRFVMEKHLGRYLTPLEVVHHINEDPSDNRIENLRLYTTQAEHIKDAHSER